MSYIFSHIFIPLVILLIFSDKLKLDKKKIVLLSFVGILPDLDVIFFHRMSFHNIFVIFPILFILLAMKKDSIAGITCFYLFSHLVLDLFNGGIAALYPFYDGIFFINAEIRSSYNIENMMYTLNYGIKNDFINNIAKSGNGYGIVSSENFGIIVLLIIIILASFIKNKNMKKIFIITLVMIILISPAMGDDNQSINKNTTYRVLVDNTYGFYRVYEANNATSVEYENRTLNISKGDTIIWINDAVPDVKLTIISKENLWDKYDGELKWNYKQFIHNFNKSGIYDIYISEYSNFQQKIIVGPIETTINKTINETNVTKSDLTFNNSNEKKINVSTTNNSIPTNVPLEKKPGTEAIVLFTVTSLLVYIFERKIK